jgi:hypothetical protein
MWMVQVMEDLLERSVLTPANLVAPFADCGYLSIGWLVTTVVALEVLAPGLAQQFGRCAVFVLLSFPDLFGDGRG